VRSDDARAHKLHEEWGEITPEAAAQLNAVRAAGGRIIAIGTTALRLLESAVQPDGSIAPFRGLTDLYLLPGHAFRSADALMTNFHLPRSTLFMLVCAFAGDQRMRNAYNHAIAQQLSLLFLWRFIPCCFARVIRHDTFLAARSARRRGARGRIAHCSW
jgi:S-adenosylmethionine:tRNA ribosyltransferase-isomerase